MTRRNPILIFGAGGPLVVDLEQSCARAGIEVRVVVANRPCPSRSGFPERVTSVEGLDDVALALPFLCPLFTPRNRSIAVAEAVALGLTPAAALIDPTSIIAGNAAFGSGVYVNAGCVIGAAVRFGAHVLVNRAASIGHHTVAEAFAAIGPGAVVAGEVHLGVGAVVGAGAVVGPGVRIGPGALVAPGAVLRHDLPEGAIALAAPTRIRLPRRASQ